MADNPIPEEIRRVTLRTEVEDYYDFSWLDGLTDEEEEEFFTCAAPRQQDDPLPARQQDNPASQTQPVSSN